VTFSRSYTLVPTYEVRTLKQCPLIAFLSFRSLVTYVAPCGRVICVALAVLQRVQLLQLPP
jgi:negative regulator of sigma E activity